MEGCNYCNKGNIFTRNTPIIKSNNNDIEVYIDSSDNTMSVDLDYDLFYEPINYCPMCGRKLVDK